MSAIGRPNLRRYLTFTWVSLFRTTLLIPRLVERPCYTISVPRQTSKKVLGHTCQLSVPRVVVVDQVLFRFSTGWFDRETSAKKVESCLKSRRIFALPNFRGRAFPHNCAHLNTPASRHVAWKKFHDVTLTSRKVIGAHTLNFKPNFTCSPLNFLGDPRPRWGCALASLGQSVVRVKIWGASTP